MRRSPLIPALLSLALVLGAAAPVAATDTRALKRASSSVKKAERALEKGDTRGAVEQFEKALEAVDGFPDALLGLGHLAMAEQRFDDALGYYQRAEAGFTELGEAMFDIRTRRYADAQNQMQDLRDSINELNSLNPAPRDLAQRIGQLENAIQRLQSVQPPDRDTVGDPPAEIYFYIGNAHFRSNRVDAAIEAWTRCAERNPQFAMVHNNLAIAYHGMGRSAQAREHLARAEELGFPVNPQFKEELAGG